MHLQIFKMKGMHKFKHNKYKIYLIEQIAIYVSFHSFPLEAISRGDFGFSSWFFSINQYTISEIILSMPSIVERWIHLGIVVRA